MNKLPDSYPFLEPCLGCFENALQTLSEQPGSPVFFGNGDFTLGRLLRAMSKLVYGADITVCCYSLLPDMLDLIAELQRNENLKEVTVFCRESIHNGRQKEICYPHIHIIDAEVNFFLLQAGNGQRNITISGVFMQDYPSHRLEMFTMHNTPQEQDMIRQTIYRTFRKQINYARS
ncbi:hypothetical protein [Parabacteroides leei]|uniref:hypothetical protein n=1 Tax=Parabacteroides leei TaxID=2939491 RepID=UPI0018981F36|nr:hypothetical protein [Parabacteroides goldsteinii]